MGQNRLSSFSGIVFLVFASIFSVAPFLSSGFTSAHDAELSIYRLYEFDKVLQDGILFPRWAPDFFFGFGFPFFNFYASLPYYIAEIPLRLGMSIPDSVETVFVLGLLLSGISMYLLAKDMFPDWAALVAGVAYVYFPYHLVDAHFRGDIGELFSFVWFPIVLLATRKILKGADAGYVILGSVAYALLVLTHNIMALIFSGMLVAFFCWTLFWQIVSRKSLDKTITIGAARVLAMVLLAVGLSAFFWLPAMTEKEDVQIHRAFENTRSAYSYKNNFSPDLLSSTLFQEYAYVDSETKRYRIEISLLQQVVVVLALPAVFMAFLRRRKKPAKDSDGYALSEIVFYISFVGLLFFLMIPVSLPVWERIPLMVYIQTPWRFLSLLGLSTSLLAGYLANVMLGSRILGKALVIGAILTIIGSSVLNLNPSRIYWLDSAGSLSGLVSYELLTQSIGTTAADEYLPKGVKSRPQTSDLVQEFLAAGTITKVRIVEGSGLIEMVSVKGNEYIINYKGPDSGELLFEVPYFPGWKAYLDDQEHLFSIDDPLGTIRMPVPAGEHLVALVFENTPIRNLAERISQGSLAVILVLIPVTLIGLRRKKEVKDEKKNNNTLRIGPSWFETGFYSLALCGIAVWHWTSGFSQNVAPQPFANSLDVRFARDIGLKGFNIENTQVQPGGNVGINFFWESSETANENLATFVHLLDPERKIVAQQDRSGFLSQQRSNWSGERSLVEDSYELKVPAAAIPGLYRVRLGLYDQASLKRLSVIEESLSIAPFQEDATFTTIAPIEVLQSESDNEYDIGIPNVANIGPGIRFLGYNSPQLSGKGEGVLQKGEVLNLILYWQAERKIEKDYTVFVHLLGNERTPDSGILVWGQKDASPFGGYYPTNSWEPGKVVSIPWQVSFRNDTPGGVYEIEMGLYEAWSGQRAQVYDSGSKITGDRVVLGRIRLVP